MDFIRKNWSRLSLAFLFLLGGIIAIISWANYADAIALANGLGLYYFIALMTSTFVFFFGMVAVAVLKAVTNSKKAVSFVYMVMGAIPTILLLVFICIANAQAPSLVSFVGVDAMSMFYMLWVPLFVFGLYPLIKGVTRFVEATVVPAKAVVEQPAAQPVVAPAAPAKKAPAKKAAAKKAE